MVNAFRRLTNLSVLLLSCPHRYYTISIREVSLVELSNSNMHEVKENWKKNFSYKSNEGHVLEYHRTLHVVDN